MHVVNNNNNNNKMLLHRLGYLINPKEIQRRPLPGMTTMFLWEFAVSFSYRLMSNRNVLCSMDDNANSPVCAVMNDCLALILF